MVKHNKTYKQNKRDNSIGIIIAVVAILVIAIVTVAIVSKGPRVSYDTYNGFSFTQTGKYWLTYVELEGSPYEVPFYNHPLDVENIYYDEEITPFILYEPHKTFYIAVSDNVGSTPVLAGTNIARVTGRLYGMPTKSALYVEEEMRDNESSFPYKTCKDATSLEPVFWIHVNDVDKRIYRDSENPYCIILGASDNEGILAVADVFVYKILQIMK